MSSDNAEKAAPAADATAAPTSAPETGAGAGAGAGAPVTVDPALAKKIIKQVDFYFSAHNLPSDKFLSEQVSKDAEGFVPLEVMLRFNRLKALSDDEKVVAAALAGSTVVTVSEDGKRIRRTKPLPTDTSATSFDECTIYAVRARVTSEHRAPVVCCTHRVTRPVRVRVLLRRRASRTTPSWRTSRTRSPPLARWAASPCAAPSGARDTSRCVAPPSQASWLLPHLLKLARRVCVFVSAWCYRAPCL